MPTTTSTLPSVSSDPLLDAVESVVSEQSRVEVAKLVAVLDWTAAHVEADAICLEDTLTARGLTVAGPGAPVVDERAALDLAAVMRVSTGSGLRYLGHAIELRHRLPRLFGRVVAGEVPVWRRTTARPAASLGTSAAEVSTRRIRPRSSVGRLARPPSTRARARKLARPSSDLEAAVQNGAQQLADLGSVETLDVRAPKRSARWRVPS